MSRLLGIAILASIMSVSHAESGLLALVKSSPAEVAASHKGVVLRRIWSGGSCRIEIRNEGREEARVTDILAFRIKPKWSGETALYGEGFTMLSQTGGTMAHPLDIGQYTDRSHYRIPERPGYRSVYGLALFHPANTAYQLLGFATCRRYSGRFDVREGEVCVSIDPEGMVLKPGERRELETLVVIEDANRSAALAKLGRAISSLHPRLKFPAPPRGWSSWYCYGPGVTAENVVSNLKAIKSTAPALKYIQIDDGYQPEMGDWLETGKSFGGQIRGVLKTIKENGFEPAIWVAPFVAGENSHLFRDHPDWFIKDEQGRPLRSDKVTFGGWRLGPWYSLDGTHPEAQKHLENLFRTMREEWGCTYFKLDANFWGAMHGGHFHDPSATRVEAYRRGMEAVLRGTKDAFVLGCNHPMWPSLGLIHGSRSSMDIDRTWSSFTSTGRENLLRSWQNGVLWWNDPDCVVLSGSQPEAEFSFHAALAYATGGMILSGDDVSALPEGKADILNRLAAKRTIPFAFADERFEFGLAKIGKEQQWALLNWSDQPVTRLVELRARAKVRNVLSGQDLGVHEGGPFAFTLQPRSGAIIAAVSLP